MTLANYPTWTERAVCASIGSDVFFLGKGESAIHAKKTCATCPVRAECLQYALDNEEEYGIWAGYDRRGLRRIRGLDDDQRANIFAELRASA